MSTTLVRPRPGPPDVPAADPVGDRGGSGWVFLLQARHDIEAHLLEGRLRDARIEVSMIKDRSGPSWLLGGSNPWAPVTLMVRRFQLDEARIVLAEIALAQPGGERPVDTRRTWRITALWATAVGLGALLTFIGLARTGTEFERCSLPLVCPAPAAP